MSMRRVAKLRPPGTRGAGGAARGDDYYVAGTGCWCVAVHDVSPSPPLGVARWGGRFLRLVRSASPPLPRRPSGRVRWGGVFCVAAFSHAASSSLRVHACVRLGCARGRERNFVERAPHQPQNTPTPHTQTRPTQLQLLRLLARPPFQTRLPVHALRPRFSPSHAALSGGRVAALGRRTPLGLAPSRLEWTREVKRAPSAPPILINSPTNQPLRWPLAARATPDPPKHPVR